MGALTLKPLAYKARPWELNNIEITNFLDSYCGQIAIQKRGNEILRILPTRKDNYFWISDQIRFFFESLKRQRVTYPYLYIKNKYIKINWQISILFLKYIKIISFLINNINTIENLLKIKNFKLFQDLFINNNKNKGDLLSNFLFQELLNKRNLIKYEFGNYQGNINQNFYNENFLTQIKLSKYNILNNINIINDYPRIWSLIKNTKLIIIGSKKTLKFNNIIINNTNQEIFQIEKSKSILSLFKKNALFFTEQNVKNKNYKQIILNKNADSFNKKWINNKKDNFKMRTDTLNWLFFKKSKNLGVNFNFLTHGVEKLFGYHVIFPITTFVEEYSLRLNPYGEIKKSVPVNIRATNMRNLAQILYIINTIFNNENKTIDFKLLQNILLLKYGNVNKENIENTEFLNTSKIQTNKHIIYNKNKQQNLFQYSEVLKIKSAFKKQKNNY